MRKRKIPNISLLAGIPAYDFDNELPDYHYFGGINYQAHCRPEAIDSWLKGYFATIFEEEEEVKQYRVRKIPEGYLVFERVNCDSGKDKYVDRALHLVLKDEYIDQFKDLKQIDLSHYKNLIDALDIEVPMKPFGQ